MAAQTCRNQGDAIRQQAFQVRRQYPELFAHLTARDRELKRALGRVPSSADIELSANWDRRGFVKRTLDAFGTGIEELVG
jgi:hypothetical protein